MSKCTVVPQLSRRAHQLIRLTPPEGKPDELLHPETVQDWLGVSNQTLKSWRMKGCGPKYIAQSPRHIVYRRDAIIEWLQSCERSTTKDAL